MKKLIIIGLIAITISSCTNQSGENKSKNPIEAKVDSVLKQMTLQEKIEQIAGIGFDTRENKRLNIPTLRMTDGPVGVRWGNATALPAAVALASSWDTALVKSVGKLLGREALVRGRNFFLGPCVNIHRISPCLKAGALRHIR